MTINVMDIFTTIVGWIVGWYTHEYYRKRMKKDIEKAFSRNKKIVEPFFSGMKKINKEFNNESITKLYVDAYREPSQIKRKELLEKAMFLASLNKLDNPEDYTAGYFELHNCTSAVYQKYLPYLISRIYLSKNQMMSSLLFNLLVEKLGDPSFFTNS